MKTISKRYNLNPHVCFFLPSHGFGIYSLDVCLHSHVWEEKHHKESVNTHLLYSLLQLPSSFWAAQIKPAVWWPSLTRSRMLWQPPVTVVWWELNLRPLSLSTRHRARCGVKKAFALFPGLVIDAGGTVVSGRLCGCRTHHNVITICERLSSISCLENVTSCLAKLLLASKILGSLVVLWNWICTSWIIDDLKVSSTLKLLYGILKRHTNIWRTVRKLHLENKTF